jgi:hypothetical protein
MRKMVPGINHFEALVRGEKYIKSIKNVANKRIIKGAQFSMVNSV